MNRKLYVDNFHPNSNKVFVNFDDLKKGGVFLHFREIREQIGVYHD